MRLTAVLAVALLGGCLDHQVREGDDGEPAQGDGSGDAPGSDAEPETEPVACFEQGAGPKCMPAPSLPVPLATTPEGDIPLRWLMSLGCIRVRYGPSMAESVALIDEAIAAWDDLTCGRLCFTAPELEDGPPGTGCHSHSIHFTTARDGFAPEVVVGSSLTFHAETGVLRSAIVSLQDLEVGTKNLVGAVGRALGLASTGAAESVLNPDTDTASPTLLDEESLCTIYGADPYCDD